jgi:phosphate-selective porin OprO/OprP
MAFRRHQVAHVEQLRSGGRERFFRYREGADPVVADGTRSRYAPQADLYSGRLGLLTEYLVSTGDVRRGAESARLSAHAWQAIASWVLTGGEASYTGVVPAAPFRPRPGHFGAVELALRLDGLRVDSAAFPRFSDPSLSAPSAHSLTGGLNWYATTHLRILVNYEVTAFGVAPGGEKRATERALAARLQLGL